MRPKGFTLIELLVVISIIAVLMGILMPTLRRARNQGRTVVCRSNLRQWGTIFHLYMDDHDGLFVTGADSGQWRWAIQSYVDKKVSTTCPEAINTHHANPALRAWGNDNIDQDHVSRGIDYGSYGINRWTYNRKKGNASEWQWRTREVKHASTIPLFLDCAFYGAEPRAKDEPPRYDGDQSSPSKANQMRRFCINRHNGNINGAMLDGHVESIGLKQLWTLKWHRQFDTRGPWTLAGGVQPQDWPEWMRTLRD